MNVSLANLGGRAQLLVGDRLVDVARASEGRLPADPMELFGRWSAFSEWARQQVGGDGTLLDTHGLDAPVVDAHGLDAHGLDAPVVDTHGLDAPVPRPRQVFGVGLNYRAHALEAQLEIPAEPMIFTKFPTCITGPTASIELTSNRVDWEVELVVVIGSGGRDISESDALGRVAGYCVGQDISDRRRQFGDNPPQFSLGKSARGFGPIGPAVTGLDALPDPNDLALSCDINGERMQDSRTSDMIFSVPTLIAYLSRHCELLPGDLIFTGTPSGVGSVQRPRRYLAPGDRIESAIEGLGRLDNRCIARAQG